MAIDPCVPVSYFQAGCDKKATSMLIGLFQAHSLRDEGVLQRFKHPGRGANEEPR